MLGFRHGLSTLVAVAALAVAGTASAADLPAPPTSYPPVYQPAIYDWSGFYFGINAGNGFGRSNWTGRIGTSTGTFSTTGVLVGGTIGANYQIGRLVLGFEADGAWRNVVGNSAVGCGSLGTGLLVVLTVSCQTKSLWFGTLRGRIGVAFERALIFASAGGAVGDIEAGTNPMSTQAGTPFNSTAAFGGSAGAGFEYAFTGHLSAKLEYLFVGLVRGSCTTACNYVAPGGAVTTPNLAVSYTDNIVRAGLNYRFDGF